MARSPAAKIRKISLAPAGSLTELAPRCGPRHLAAPRIDRPIPVGERLTRIGVLGTARAKQGSMNGQRKAPDKPAGAPKLAPPKPAIRLDDLIPNEKVLGGRRVTFGVRTKPVSKS